MEITGFGTDFLIDFSFGERVVRFIEAQRERWPSLYFGGVPVAESFGAEWQLEIDPDAKYSEILTFSSGAEMEEFWEDSGYSLDVNGEGPFSIFYQFHRSRIGARLQGIEAADQEVATAADGVELLMSEFFLVSLVTPADPAEDEFSRSVLADFRRVFEG
ncbi:hypothetical protein [Kitasatospora sp. NBC_01302]|uniref:hypothetical protein n=1 Tax=Kitasatospora sp. NBC_01302 TaxID=2903575 RepID=UPI002E12B803|nr:hypothetical protein OG294_21505 [Kitasatospora sp. NBC_01302]